MRHSFRTLLSLTTVLSLLIATSQLSPVLAGSGSRLEGILVGVDGRPAAGHRVQLIGPQGEAFGTSTTTDDGQYAFHDLEAGEYGLMIEGPGGQLGALAGPPLRLGPNELARRDLKLLEAGPAGIDGTLEANYGLKARYASMSTAEQVWTWVVIVLVGGLTLFLIFDNDNNNEQGATEFQ